MTHDEKEALLGYLEFNLTSMVEGLEVQYGHALTPMTLRSMYDAAYEVLNEIERSLTEVTDQNVS